MKNSGVEWIGEIPDGWEVKKLKYICDSLASGGTPDSNNDQYYCENGTNWVAINDMSLVDYVENTAKHITNLAINEKKLKIYPKGTIIYSIYATLGHVAELSKPACINQALLALSIKDKSFNKSYFKYSLNAMKEYVLAFSSGNTQFNLNAQKVRNFTLLTPSFETQQRIASYLDKKCSKIEETIQNQQQVIEKLKAYKQSLITEAVTGKIKIQNDKACGKYENYKDSGVEWIGKIPSEWEAIKAKYFIKISNGSDPKTEEGDTPVYGSGAESFKTCVEFKNGPTVLIGRKGATLHIPHYIETNYWNVDTAFDVKTYSEEKFLLRFYYYCATAFDYKFYLTSTTLPSMTQTNYGNMYLPVPKTQVQKEIVEFLNNKCIAIDTAIEQKQNLIEKLTEYKKSLIYECVTGKKAI